MAASAKAPRRHERKAAAGPARTRLPRGERRRRIVAEAADLFAEAGFGASTHALARRLGVTQALIYRYFPSKQALIEAVFDAAFTRRWQDDRGALLRDAAVPLEERLVRFYGDLVREASPTTLRLFVQAGLSGTELPLVRSRSLTERVLQPVVAALRQEVGLPGFAERPLLRGERELAMMLHAAVMFLNIRRFVYQMPMPENLEDAVALYVQTWLGGAAATLRDLHAAPADSALAVRQLTPGD